MPRIVNPDYLVLQLASLDDAFAAGRVKQVEAKLGPLLRRRKFDTREPGVPVSLRWALSPDLGFPRAPFEVWRRVRKEQPTAAVLGTGAAPQAPNRVTLSTEVIEIRFDARPVPGRSLTVEALALNGDTLPGQRLTFTSDQPGRFRGAGIARLQLSGAGRILNVAGLSQTDWANLPDWVRIEVVGFPFEPGTLPASSYDTSAAQGWEAASSQAPEAARIRLTMAQLLQLDPPPVGAGGLVPPPWPFPDPGTFLDVLGKGPGADIADCLVASDDTDPLRLQGMHAITRPMPGMRQSGQPAGSDPAHLTLTTTRYIALATQDSPVAVGLGFGTVDIPQAGPPLTPLKDVLPPGTLLGREEYMVTAPVVLPGGVRVDLAALGHRVTPPAAAAGLTATQTFANRAPLRDGDESVTVRLSWTPTVQCLGTGLLSRRPPAGTDLLNTERPASSGGFQPYLTGNPIAPDGNPLADFRPGLSLPDEPVPKSGSSTTSYAVAGIDSHGRWGPWQLTSHTVTARPVQQPGLHETSITLPEPLPASGPVAGPCTLTAEVSWDWADRSCHRIEIAGAFVPLGPLPEPAPEINGFQLADTAVAGAPVVILFSASGTPSIAAPGTVSEIAPPTAPGAPPPADTAADVRRYRVTLPGMSLSFATAGELGFAVSARGAEVVRPSELSEQTRPRQITVGSPFPAPPPPLPNVDVLWTAQPDADGHARAVLSWPASAGAHGYILWEATETALFHAVTGGGSPPAGLSIRARAADLKARVAAARAASLQTFSRLNERPLRATSFELALPGSADTLYAYRISTVTAQNIESARSTDIVLVGVARREVPSAPRLEATGDPATARVSLTVVPGPGIAPAHLRLHRVRREAPAEQIGSMGPPVVGPVPVAALTPVTVPALSGPPTTGFVLTDSVVPGWRPYLYRCVAVGRDIQGDGVRAGDSEASNVAAVLVPPPTPPLVAHPLRTTSPTRHLVTFETDLPWAPSPAGSGVVTVAAVTVTGATAVRTPLCSFYSEAIPEVPDGPPTPDGPPAVTTAASATRLRPVAGLAAVSLILPPATGTLVLTVTDPLGRSTTTELV